MSPKVRLLFYGPDRFCPDCGRWLVRAKDDGRFDLAAMAAITTEARMSIDYQPPAEVDTLITDATCLRCHPEQPQEEPVEEKDNVKYFPSRDGRSVKEWALVLVFVLIVVYIISWFL